MFHITDGGESRAWRQRVFSMEDFVERLRLNFEGVFY
jgi:hypothetical protein